jgi:hypothetical protein
LRILVGGKTLLREGNWDTQGSLDVELEYDLGAFNPKANFEKEKLLVDVGMENVYVDVYFFA